MTRTKKLYDLELMRELMKVFKEKGIDFFIVGALARDLILEKHGLPSGRATKDIDFLVALPDWGKYEILSQKLCELENFSKDEKIVHRFKYKGVFDVDIIPFGEISDDEDKIFWPPDERYIMSLLGAEEAAKMADSVENDPGIEIKVVNLAGLFVLKFIAWFDRHNEGNKDADDIGLIMQNYPSVNIDRIFNHDDIVEKTDADMFLSGAMLLGKDIYRMFENNEKRLRFGQLLQDEYKKNDGSILLMQILETHPALNFKDIFIAFEYLVDEINSTQ